MRPGFGAQELEGVLSAGDRGAQNRFAFQPDLDNGSEVWIVVYEENFQGGISEAGLRPFKGMGIYDGPI